MEFSDNFFKANGPEPFPVEPEYPPLEPLGFHWADIFVFVLFLLVSLGIGMAQGIYNTFFKSEEEKEKEKQDDDLEKFHMGNRDFSVWPVALSTLSAFLSAILILGTPAEIYTQGTEYWIYVFGMMLAVVFALLLFVPLLYPLKLTSSYEYLELRFRSKAAKLTGSIILLVMQLLYMGVCLYSPATALEAVTGFPEYASILIGGFISMFYVALGGMKASVWTSAFQAFVMAAGVIMVIVQASIELDGFGNIWEINKKYPNRVEFFNFDPNPLERHTFWTMVVGGTMSWLSTYGVNQASVQRYSSVPTIRDARLVLLWNIPGLFIMVSLCVMAGMSVFAWYDYVGCDPLASGLVSNSNQLLPYYVMDRLYIPGIPGIFLACLFAGALSTMSSSLGACTAVTWEDALKYQLGHLSNSYQVLVNKALVIVFGFGGMGMAFMVRNLGGTVLQASLSFTGAASGPLLGLFLYGGIFPWGNWLGAVIGGIVGLAFPLWVSFGAYDLVLQPQKILDFNTLNCTQHNFTLSNATLLPTRDDIEGIERLYLVSYMWYPAIGAATVVVVGLIVSLFTGLESADDMDPKYLIPIFDRLFPCLPQKWRTALRCHIPEPDYGDDKPEDEEKTIDAYSSNGNIGMENMGYSKASEANENMGDKTEELDDNAFGHQNEFKADTTDEVQSTEL